MSAPSKQPLTVDESLQILQAKIKDLPNGDDLTVKLYRKRGGALGAAGIPDVFAVLSGARLAHVANPEMWIPRLAGAGSFLMSVYSSDDQVRPLTTYIPFFVEGPSREVDLDAVIDPNWRGPARLDWPERRVPQQQQQGGYSVNLAPPAPPLASAPQTQTSGTGAPGAHFQQPQAAPPIDRHIADWMATKERELAEAKAALELERERLRSEARFAQLEARLTAQAEASRAVAAAPPPPPPPAPPKESIADILKAGMPLIQQVLTGQQEMRLEMMKVSQAQQAETRELMKAVLTRPAIDPTMLALIERRDANEQPASAILAQATAAMSTMMENTMLMARQVAESSGAPAESPMLTAFREVAGAVEKIATASIQAPKPKPRRQAGPPAAVAVQPPAAQPPQPTSGAAGGAGAPTNVVPFQRPSEAVVDGGAQVQQLGGVDGLEEGLLDRLEQMIRSHEEPAKVAAYLVSIFNSDEFQDALQAADGSIPTLFQVRLGAWSMDPTNLPYGQALLNQVVEQGTAAGIFQDEPGGEDSGDADDQEAEG